ncbi:MAG TPA: type II toxin-antitoxin system VapC family toxin [Patescibacteria group bacterium]|nr:type II toxin-antitoxin system VapC family toxin [Patescibacteria group bacterium]
MPATDRRLVVDASVVVKACLSPTGLTLLTAHGQLAAPYLLWSEATAAFRELNFRGEIDAETASAALATLLTGAIEPTWSDELLREATDIAARLGWAKTYDAEYVALAHFLDAPLVTVDARLKRGARALVHVIGPTEL